MIRRLRTRPLHTISAKLRDAKDRLALSERLLILIAFAMDSGQCWHHFANGLSKSKWRAARQHVQSAAHLEMFLTAHSGSVGPLLAAVFVSTLFLSTQVKAWVAPLLSCPGRRHHSQGQAI